MAKRRIPNKNTPKELREIPEEIKTLNSKEVISDKVAEVTVVKCKTLNVRKEPEKGDNVIFVVSVGDNLTLLKEKPNWSLVESVKHGKTGWVMSEFVELVQ